MKILEAFQAFNIDPGAYFRSCNSQEEADNTLNMVKEIVKKQYRKLALKYHPDSASGKGDANKFNKFTEAKKVILALKIQPMRRPEPVVEVKWYHFGYDVTATTPDYTSTTVGSWYSCF